MKIEFTISILILFATVSCKKDISPSTVATQATEAPIASISAVQEPPQSTEEFNRINATILNGRLAMEETQMDVESVARILFIPESVGGAKV